MGTGPVMLYSHHLPAPHFRKGHPLLRRLGQTQHLTQKPQVPWMLHRCFTPISTDCHTPALPTLPLFYQ